MSHVGFRHGNASAFVVVVVVVVVNSKGMCTFHSFIHSSADGTILHKENEERHH